MKSKLCQQCGKPVKSGQKFCTGCGTPLPEDRYHAYEKNKAVGPRKYLPHVIAVIVLCAAVLGMINGRSSGTSSKKYNRHMKELDLSNQSLTSLEDLADYTDLETLVLNGNEISDFSALANMPSLERLELEDNCLTDVSFLAYCPNLKHLNLAKNAIQDITPARDLEGLVSLDISHNQLTDIDILSGLQHLTYLDSSYNPFGPGRYFDASEFPVLEELYLSHCHMQVFSDHYSNFTHLKKLDLSYNGMMLYPDAIQTLNELTELEELNVCYNTFYDSGLGMETFDMPSLSTLTINPVGDLLYPFDSSLLPNLEKVNIVVAAENSFTLGNCSGMKNAVQKAHPNCEITLYAA